MAHGTQPTAWRTGRKATERRGADTLEGVRRARMTAGGRQELGYVYLPIGTPTNDWYGGHRLGDNLFAESLV